MSLEKNLAFVRGRIVKTCEKVGRTPEEVKLVAVSKTKPPSMIMRAWEAGQMIFGENYVQEFVSKSEHVGSLSGIRFHFIGHLQRNKVKHLMKVKNLYMIETVDSIRLLREIEKRAGEVGRKVDALIEVNVGGEESKSGIAPGEVLQLLDEFGNCRNVICKGLMAIPPFEDDPEESRKWFKKLFDLRESLGGSSILPELSMGMSSDFEVAIEEGATIVRVGTAIFGAR